MFFEAKKVSSGTGSYYRCVPAGNKEEAVFASASLSPARPTPVGWSGTMEAFRRARASVQHAEAKTKK